MATESRELTLSQIQALPRNDKVNAFKRLLRTKVHSLLDLLPVGMQTEEQAQRLVNRAGIYFSMKGYEFDVASVFQAILQAAEVGLAIDGKLAHVVNFGGSAVLNIDYKGLVAVAKRSGQIYDVQGDIVGENDEFFLARENEKTIFRHVINPRGRGEVIGAYSRIFLRERVATIREYKMEYMTREQLDSVKAIAKSQNGPWKTWPEQMQIKTVIRRSLKMYADDPSLARAFELSDAGDGGYTLDVVATPKTASVSNISLSAPPVQQIGHTVQEELDLPMNSAGPTKQEYDAEPRAAKKKKAEEQQQKQEAKQPVNEDAEPEADEGKAEEKPTPKMSERGQVWLDWVAKTTVEQNLTDSFATVPSEKDLPKNEKPIIIEAIRARIAELKGVGGEAGPGE